MTEQDAIAAIIQDQFQQEVAFLQRLVRAKSSNPFTPETMRPDHPVEAEVATVIHQELLRLDYQPEVVGISAQRPNVLCHIRGDGSNEKTLILTTHMDTVEPNDYTRDPWGAQMEQGRLYGVGVADAKAQIAAFIYAVRALRQAGVTLAGNITLAFVADEEVGACSQYGTHYLLEHGLLHGDAAIVGEPGSNSISIGHRGLYRFRLQIKGEATHTGIRAWEQGRRGRNAILDMTRLVQTLAEHPLPDIPSQAFPNRRSVLTFPTLIKGGSGISIVPSACEAYGDVRLLPGLSASQLRAIILEHLQRLDIQDYQLDDLLAIPAVEISQQEEIVQVLAAAVETVTGNVPRLEGAGPACDGWMFITRGIPAICGYGVQCGGVHGADEWADLASLREVTEVHTQAIVRFFQHST